jgi:hypothetical protein
LINRSKEIHLFSLKNLRVKYRREYTQKLTIRHDEFLKKNKEVKRKNMEIPLLKTSIFEGKFNPIILTRNRGTMSPGALN